MKIFGTLYEKPFEIFLEYYEYNIGDILSENLYLKNYNDKSIVIDKYQKYNTLIHLCMKYDTPEEVETAIQHFEFLRKYNLTGWAII